jgi:hypothetical protein
VKEEEGKGREQEKEINNSEFDKKHSRKHALAVQRVEFNVWVVIVARWVEEGKGEEEEVEVKEKRMEERKERRKTGKRERLRLWLH